jgi:hypothetical protein
VKTVSRSATRKIAALQGRLTDCKVYTLENYFQGKTVEPRYAWAALASNSHARLTDHEDGTYTVHVHDNCWYKLRTAAAEQETS